MNTAPVRDVGAAALAYRQRGWAPIPIPKGLKYPVVKGWQNLRLNETDIPLKFQDGQNIGVLLGAPSGGLIDIDLDVPQATALAPMFLPQTGSVFGRVGKPRSHWLYTANPVPPYESFQDVGKDGAMLVELRGTGRQSVFPPSTHVPSGETVAFDYDDGPASVDAEDLRERVARLATATLLVRHWPSGQSHRQDIAMALAGALLRNGWTVEDAQQFVEAVARAAGDEEAAKRRAAVVATAQKVEAGAPTTGFPRLADLVGRDVVNKIITWLRLHPAPTPAAYHATDSGIVWARSTPHGNVSIPLTNFTARIAADILEDSGVDTTRSFELEAQVRGRSMRFAVPAAQFAAMNWIPEHLGAHAIVQPGQGLRDHARAAIQLLSTDVVERRAYVHTGWRQVAGSWVYLHAEGAIGQDGPVPGIDVRLPDELRPFSLPSPPEGEALVTAVRASLRLLSVAPHDVTVPLFAAIYRAVLGATDFSLHIAGPTGLGKTAIAALAQQHFGAAMDGRHPPGNWSSTANSLESLAFHGKDALLLVDDFAPSGSPNDVQRLHRDADRLLRAQGNRSGRTRMRADTSLRRSKPPRGLVLSTGEETPRGASLRARIVILEFPPDATDWAAMTRCQNDAANGLYAAALSGFLRWLAGRYPTIQQTMADEIAARRTTFEGPDLHQRSADILASLAWGLDRFLAFALDVGAITSQVAEALRTEARRAFERIAHVQAARQKESDVVTRFVGLLRAVLASGQAHIADVDGLAPAKHQRAYGWWLKGETGFGDWEPKGARIGWLDGEDLYLEPDASFAAAQRMARDTGEALSVSAPTLHQRLKDRNLLKSVDDTRKRVLVRRILEGARRYVLHLPTESLFPVEDTLTRSDTAA